MNYSNDIKMNAVSFINEGKSENKHYFNGMISWIKTKLFSEYGGKIGEVLNTIKNESPILFWIAMIEVFLGVICAIGYVSDDRMLMGVSTWLKPLKFCITTVIYVLTVGFLTTLYPYSKRKKWFINGVVAWTLFFELAIIVVQGARGVQSHYNFTSQIDALLFAAMGILIGINVVIMVLFIIDTARLKMKTSKSIQWSIFIGWVLVLVGSWVGGQMIGQMSHTVGAVDGGAGLPLVNWSTIAGDLRIAHFFGIHGIQIIPVFALLLANIWKTSDKNRIIVVTGFGLVYAASLAYTFYQASQGIALLNM
ncbi:MAG: hypothetical protein P1U56_15790 [Saprospiraceae bacterium]|nr:hypothetical protein [Saprospiraceae bacterium]